MVKEALAPYVRRLSDPEPLVYSVREAAHVLATSTNTVRRLIDEGGLPTCPTWDRRSAVDGHMRRAVGAEVLVRGLRVV